MSSNGNVGAISTLLGSMDLRAPKEDETPVTVVSNVVFLKEMAQGVPFKQRDLSKREVKFLLLSEKPVKENDLPKEETLYRLSSAFVGEFTDGFFREFLAEEYDSLIFACVNCVLKNSFKSGNYARGILNTIYLFVVENRSRDSLLAQCIRIQMSQIVEESTPDEEAPIERIPVSGKSARTGAQRIRKISPGPLGSSPSTRSCTIV